MRKATKAIGGAVGLLALLVGVGWLGLQVSPVPFSPHPERTRKLDTAKLPSDLPEPVYRHFQATLGREVPRIETAVVWGRADFKVNGLWTPMRFKSYHVAGREFRRDMVITWFGLPILQGTDAYLREKGSLKIIGLVNMSSTGERFDQGENLAMWGEAPFTTPSALVLDPRVRWEPIGRHAARLIVPFGEMEESLRVEFDPETGLMRSMSGMRYRGEEETKAPWRGEYSEWRTVHGIKLPHRAVAAWEDQKEPYINLHVESTEYNVDISEQIP